MSRLLPFFVTAALALSSIWAGIDSYLRTETTIVRDLTRALTLTAQEQPVDWLSTDTIRTFRSHLQMGELRENAYLAFCLMDQRRQQAAGTVASDTLVVTDHVQAQGYATCSAFAIWRMSDQRLSAVLALLTCIMLCMCLQKTRKVQIKLADAPSSQDFLWILLPSFITRKMEKACTLLSSPNSLTSCSPRPPMSSPSKRSAMLSGPRKTMPARHSTPSSTASSPYWTSTPASGS